MRTGLKSRKIRKKLEKFLPLGDKLVKKIKVSKEEMDEIKFIDAENRKVVEKEVKEGKIKVYIGGELSCLDDDVITKCDVCGADVVVRPWAKELIDKYGLTVKCIKCAGGESRVAIKTTEWFEKVLSTVFKPL